VEAEKYLKQALAEAKQGFGEDDPHVAGACNNLAELHRLKKDFHAAEVLYQEVCAASDAATALIANATHAVMPAIADKDADADAANAIANAATDAAAAAASKSQSDILSFACASVTLSMLSFLILVCIEHVWPRCRRMALNWAYDRAACVWPLADTFTALGLESDIYHSAVWVQ